MEAPEPSLRELFTLTKSRIENLDTFDPRTSDFKSLLQSAIESLERCRQLVQQLALFSTNEEAEDISTQDIQYLTVDYLLSELHLKSYGADRLATLQRSSQLLEGFLSGLDNYRLLGSSDHKLYEQFLEQRSRFRVISTTNPEERRNRKIGRFQEEKALKQKLQYLREESAKVDIDEDTVRQLYFAEIAFYVNQAFSSLDMVSQEMEIVAQMQQAPPAQSQPPTEDPRAPARANGYSDRLEGPTTMGGLGRRGGPLLDSKGKPLQPFTITDKRSQLQKGVFRPGHNLPTMSIDEYLEEERRRGGIIEGGGNANEPQPEVDEDNMEVADAATMKAREWDDFVEANPKGAGNRLNRG